MKSKTNKSKEDRQRKPAKKPAIVSNTFPMRINKYLAHKGVATRTGVDELIKSSKVLINGVVAKLGDKVLETDKVEVRGTHNKKNFVYFAFNKPKGVVSTNPQGDEKDIMGTLKDGDKKFEGVFPVGRIDKESHGLMILTNDGRITDRLLNPIYNHEKEYVVKIDRNHTPGFLRNMQDGVDIGDGMTKPSKVKKVNEDTFSITLTEGRNRQIRRMTEKLGYTVRDLQRVRVQNIKLGKLQQNAVEEITGEEKVEFLKSIGLE
jgi:23S rRNA pseudouridine2604 synthase